MIFHCFLTILSKLALTLYAVRLYPFINVAIQRCGISTIEDQRFILFGPLVLEKAFLNC
jgi:hypothetical protein